MGRQHALRTLQNGALFKPRWHPPFIESIGEHDCCHLNGLAMRNGQPAYVSMIAHTAMPAGWREHKRDGGCIQNVVTNEIVCSGLAMPHSPRCYADQLWVLNSGQGHFGYVDLNAGKFVTVEFLPGFLRGLSFAQNFAFVGLSRGRETNLFGGLPITESSSDMRCGVGIVDLTTGRTVAVLQFHSGVDEIFAVEVQPGCHNPLYGGSQQDGKEREVWLL